MQDTELNRYLLDLKPPWKVEQVKLDVINQRVDVWAVHNEGLRWPCSECGAMMPLYDHTPERTWRHLDSCQFMTFLHARPPRVHCKKHGVRRVRLPWYTIWWQVSTLVSGAKRSKLPDGRKATDFVLRLSSFVKQARPGSGWQCWARFLWFY